MWKIDGNQPQAISSQVILGPKYYKPPWKIINLPGQLTPQYLQAARALPPFIHAKQPKPRNPLLMLFLCIINNYSFVLFYVTLITFSTLIHY